MSKPGIVPLTLAVAFGAVLGFGSAVPLWFMLGWLGWLRLIAVLIAIAAVIVGLSWAWCRLARANR